MKNVVRKSARPPRSRSTTTARPSASANVTGTMNSVNSTIVISESAKAGSVNSRR